MKRSIQVAVSVMAIGLLAYGLARGHGQAKAPPAEEQAIRGVVDAFVKAFNSHDAAAVAALFLADAKIIPDDDTVVEGRQAIAEVFAAQFAENPKTSIEVNVESVKFVGSDMAVEIGSTKVTPGPGQEPELNRYTVIYLKRDGKWLMALARDSEGESLTNHQRLQALEWLVGEWVDESPEAVVTTSCRWSPDGNFLLQDIQIKSAGKAVMTVNQRIGWDAVNKCVRSWVFDSEGGFGDGTWARDGDHWIIKATGVRTDGTTASATNSVTRMGNDLYVWHSADRVIAGVLDDPIEVRVVRKPPAAGSKKD